MWLCHRRCPLQAILERGLHCVKGHISSDQTVSSTKKVLTKDLLNERMTVTTWRFPSHLKTFRRFPWGSTTTSLFLGSNSISLVSVTVFTALLSTKTKITYCNSFSQMYSLHPWLFPSWKLKHSDLVLSLAQSSSQLMLCIHQLESLRTVSETMLFRILVAQGILAGSALLQPGLFPAWLLALSWVSSLSFDRCGCLSLLVSLPSI